MTKYSKAPLSAIHAYLDLVSSIAIEATSFCFNET